MSHVPEAFDLLRKLGAHPTRLLILAEYANTDADLSPNELSKRIGVNLGVTSYHVRALTTAGALKVTRTVQVRGAIQHHYRPNGRSRLARQLAAELELLAVRMKGPQP